MTVYGRVYRGSIYRQWLDARPAAFFDNLSPRLAQAYEAAWAGGNPLRRRLWHGLLRPGLDRRLLRG